jgi:hypothetical protein
MSSHHGASLAEMLFAREEEHTWHLELKLWYVKYRFHCVEIPDPLPIKVNSKSLKRKLNLLILISLAIIFGALSSASGRSACHPQSQ